MLLEFTVGVADIGGTETRVAISCVRVLPGKRLSVELIIQDRYQTPSILSPEEFLAVWFNGREGHKLDAACVAVASVVKNNKAIHGVNLPWSTGLDGADLARQVHAPVFVINDFLGVASAVAWCRLDLAELSAGVSCDSTGNRAALGPGTGLGEAVIPYSQGEFRPCAGEGSHGDLGPISPIQDRWVQFMRAHRGRANWDTSVSGPGLVDMLEFFTTVEGLTLEPPIRAELDRAQAKDRPGIITTHALSGTSQTCQTVTAFFLELLGQEAGNLGLTVNATGGVYIAGGIAPKLGADFLRTPVMAGFLNKGEHRDVVTAMPLYLIQTPDPGLLGAAAYPVMVHLKKGLSGF